MAGAPWGEPFTSSLHEWLKVLCWPPQPQPAEDDLGCSYLEMMIHFFAWSGVSPPTKVAHADKPFFLDSTSAEASLQPRTAETWAGTFHEAVVFLARANKDLLPARQVFGLLHLRSLGYQPLEAGVDRRPLFMAAGDWIPLLVQTCRARTLEPLFAFVSSGP